MATDPGPLPRWLQRPHKPLPFVVTICAGRKFDGVLARFGDICGEIAVLDQRRLAPGAASVDIECTPRGAWELFARARASLGDADIYLRPRDDGARRLLICDMDMTIVAAETLDEVAASLGLGERIASITARAMHGEIDFDKALRERIAMLAGHSEQAFHEVARNSRFNPGAEELLAAAHAAGVHTILISGGFAQVVEPVARRLGFDEFHCNQLELEEGRLTGRVLSPIVNADLKRGILQQRAQALGIALRDCCAIGDGANDRAMIETAGLGIAYRAKPVLREATLCRIDATDLGSAAYFMGLE